MNILQIASIFISSLLMNFGYTIIIVHPKFQHKSKMLILDKHNFSHEKNLKDDDICIRCYLIFKFQNHLHKFHKARRKK